MIQGALLCHAEELRRLPERKPTTGARFTKVPSSHSLVSEINAYDDPRIWAERYHEFSVGAIGSGVAVADYDKDGRLDLLVVHKCSSVRLYRNKGDWRFEDVTASSGLLSVGAEAAEWKQGALWADFDNDGWSDLYLCRYAAPNQLFMNRGDGTFRECADERGVALIDASGMATVADYDSDGWLDLLVQTNILDSMTEPSGRPNRIYRNRGGAIFDEVTNELGVQGRAQGHSAIWTDVTGDGKTDLYIANDFAEPDRFYQMGDDGRYRDTYASVFPVMPYHAMGSDFADFDRDGRMDIFVAEMARRDPKRDVVSIGDTRSRMKKGDRLAVPYVLRNTLFLQSVPGRFTEQAWRAGVAASDWTWSARAEDFDEDGWVDLHCTNGMVREYDHADLRARMMAAEGTIDRINLMRRTEEYRSSPACFRNQGDGVFAEVSADWGLTDEGVFFGSATADFDADGDLDLAYITYNGETRLWRNNTVGSHRLVVDLEGSSCNRDAIGARVTLHTQDGRLQTRWVQPARGYLSSSSLSLHFGLGEIDTVQKLEVIWPDGSRELHTDVSANRHLRIRQGEGAMAFESDKKTPIVGSAHVVRAASGLAESRPAPQALEPLWDLSMRGSLQALEDAKGGWEGFCALIPARSEVLWVDAQMKVQILLRDSAAGVRHQGPLWLGRSSPADTGRLLVFEVPAQGARSRVRAWKREGEDWRGEVEEVCPVPQGIVSAVVSSKRRENEAAYLVVFHRAFLPRTLEAAPPDLWVFREGGWVRSTDGLSNALLSLGSIVAASVVDIDADGAKELVVAEEWGRVRVFAGEAPRWDREITTSLGLGSAPSGPWTRMEVADLNGDAVPEIVLGAWGNNNPFSQAGMIGRWEGRWTGRPQPLVLDVRRIDGEWYPRPTLRTFTSSRPPWWNAIRSHANFADQTMVSLYEAKVVESARKWEIDQFSSGVLWGSKDKYHWQPLPPEAQIAPIVDMVISDLDADGIKDLLLLQNWDSGTVASESWTGGIGLMLAGRRGSNWEHLDGETSGVVWPGQGGALLLQELNRAQGTAVLWRLDGEGRLLRHPIKKR